MRAPYISVCYNYHQVALLKVYCWFNILKSEIETGLSKTTSAIWEPRKHSSPLSLSSG